MPRPLIPPWLRRGLEAAIVAALVAIITLAADRLGSGAVPYPLPGGLTGVLLLAAPVLVLSVLPTAYPVAMAATRADAVMGAIAGWLLAVDITILFTGGHVALDRFEIVLPTAVLVGVLTLLPAAIGLAASQLGTSLRFTAALPLAASLGFGRRAGAAAAIASGAAGVLTLAVVGVAA